MKRGKFERKSPIRRRRAKPFLLLLSIVLILGLSIGGTVAYLAANSQSVENQFTPGQVSCAVGTDGKITNTGNVKAYLRASVIANWVDADGNIVVKNAAPNFTVAAGWTNVGGIYYYKDAVEPGASVAFVTSAAPDGAGIEIAAEAIQAEGMGAENAQDAWFKAAMGN